ncbi:helix-turn-helix transcriptional regulator [Salinicoccus kekensis]|uniref:Sigma-70-like protein n=1 Tax=Salinicoccus kekensis TaxID=714307 RepID=A0A285UAP8_9STAP|nr:sigma factor-like helix-turn-helix DNA-binding protein [Salinicoccus kekensis]SOC38995.1 sigma-70-like protein [Salinicoccus kekensis]
MISLLIMDVSGSTRATKELPKEIKWLEHEISCWLDGEEKSYVNYRMGDELFVLSSKPHFTLFIAFYAKLLWWETEFPLKCSFHTVDIQYPDVDPEEWTDASVKDVRNSLDAIKNSSIQDFAGVGMPEAANVALMYATDILNNLTKLQREVLLLKMTGITQKEIAEILNKSHSTISAHFRKSRGAQLEVILNFLESHYKDETDITELKKKVVESIRKSGEG